MIGLVVAVATLVGYLAGRHRRRHGPPHVPRAVSLGLADPDAHTCAFVYGSGAEGGAYFKHCKICHDAPRMPIPGPGVSAPR
jgi:hypothetical protein